MSRKLLMPSDTEDARINQGIADDPDTMELTGEALKTAVPARDILPSDIYASLTRRTRGPGKRPAKQLVTLRLDQDVIDALRRSGKGWQVRANQKLRELIS